MWNDSGGQHGRGERGFGGRGHGHHGGHDGGRRGGRRGGGRDWGAWAAALGERFDEMFGAFEGPGRGGSRGGGGGGRGRRMFEGAELRLILLKLIADEARHGYELIRAVETMTGGAYAPSPGVVYPHLSMLDEMDLVAEQRSDDAKKRFAITEDGTAYLAKRGEEVERLFAKLAALGEMRQRQGGSPVWRAVRNLGMVIRDRKEHGDLTDAQKLEIADMIDDLARRIERMR